MRNNIRLKIRDLVRRGGSRYGGMKIPAPQVTATSASDKLQGNMAKQQEMDAELVKMNKELSGGGVVVPQFTQGGPSANSSVKQQIGSTLQGGADGEYDQEVLTPDQAAATKSTIGGRRRKNKKKKKKEEKKKQKRKENHEENLKENVEEVKKEEDNYIKI